MFNVVLQENIAETSSLAGPILFWGGAFLLVLVFLFLLIKTIRKFDSEHAVNQHKDQNNDHDSDIQEEEAAAIALAIHLYKSELHDQESLTITLQKVSRIYSPWSSKIYTLRQNPRR
jgi:hypothetical protein